MTVSEFRRLAMSLPEVSEEDHHGVPSFRVRKKIFATVPDDEHVHVMIGPAEAASSARAEPTALQELWWGKRLAGVRARLVSADRRLLEPLLAEAWRLRAPKRLRNDYDSSKRKP